MMFFTFTSTIFQEYDEESEDYEAEDYSELDVVLKEVVSIIFRNIQKILTFETIKVFFT